MFLTGGILARATSGEEFLRIWQHDPARTLDGTVREFDHGPATTRIELFERMWTVNMMRQMGGPCARLTWGER